MKYLKISITETIKLDHISSVELINEKGSFSFWFICVNKGYASDTFKTIAELYSSLKVFDTLDQALMDFIPDNEKANITNPQIKFLHEESLEVKSNTMGNLNSKSEVPETQNGLPKWQSVDQNWLIDVFNKYELNSVDRVMVDYVNWKDNIKKDLVIIPKKVFKGFSHYHPNPEEQYFLEGFDYEEYNNPNRDAIKLKHYLISSMNNIRIHRIFI